MTTAKRPTPRTPKTPQTPAPRTIEDVNQDLEKRLAQYQQERTLFNRLVSLSAGRMDLGVVQIVLQRIHDDEMAAREVAASEIRAVLAVTEN